MQKNTGILFVFLCIAFLFIAGCANKETANVTPQIVYITVLVTPTPVPTTIATVTPEMTLTTISPEMILDEEFIDYVNSNKISEAMESLEYANPGAYSISTGYNAASREEAERLTAILVKSKMPGTEKVKAYRSAMLNALAVMDGSTAGFSRYRDAMETVILTKNAAFAELHSTGSGVVNAINLAGHGDDVRMFNTTQSGEKIFTMHHDGDHNFAITLKDEDGRYISLLANEIGEYNGKKSENLTAGNYTLDITADGEWTIGIRSG